MLEQIVELREQTIRQTSHDVIHQWRTERGPEKITGIIRTSWSEPKEKHEYGDNDGTTCANE